MADSTDTFTRIGKPALCYRFEDTYEDAFRIWHITTRWFESQAELDKKKQKKINWGKKKNAIEWPYFDEGALQSDGTPKIICIRCRKILAHPTLNGTSGMSTHLSSEECRKSSKAQGLVQLEITEGFRAGVLP
jgi:hypothetical protein